MDRRDGEIGDRDTTRSRHSIEWRAHSRFAEYWSAPNALGLRSYHDADLKSNSRTCIRLALSRRIGKNTATERRGYNSLPLRLGSLSEDRRPHPNQRRAFFNRD